MHGPAELLHNKDVSALSTSIALTSSTADYRLRKHAEYQRVYREGRKHFSSSMSYFFALRAASPLQGPRVGLTAGKVLGKAVERNRIKRRLREIVRRRATLVTGDVDIVLHPRRAVLTIEFARLDSEIVRIFTGVQSAIDNGDTKPKPRAERATRVAP
jgi:ribonuclease P protein component